MTDSYALELRELIDRAFSVEYSGRATKQMLHTSVYRDLPEHLLDYLVGQGIKKQISAYFNARDDAGLPVRPEVNENGEHVQLDFMSLPEFRFVYDGYLKRIDANRAQAEKLRSACLKTHRVDLGAIEARA